MFNYNLVCDKTKKFMKKKRTSNTNFTMKTRDFQEAFKSLIDQYNAYLVSTKLDFVKCEANFVACERSINQLVKDVNLDEINAVNIARACNEILNAMQEVVRKTDKKLQDTRLFESSLDPLKEKINTIENCVETEGLARLIKSNEFLALIFVSIGIYGDIATVDCMGLTACFGYAACNVLQNYLTVSKNKKVCKCMTDQLRVLAQVADVNSQFSEILTRVNTSALNVTACLKYATDCLAKQEKEKWQLLVEEMEKRFNQFLEYVEQLTRLSDCRNIFLEIEDE